MINNYNFCPCCGYLTMSEDFPGSFEICPVCYWEDDLLQLENPDFSGGANYVSLNEAIKNFKIFKVSDNRYINNVREALHDEIHKSENNH